MLQVLLTQIYISIKDVITVFSHMLLSVLNLCELVKRQRQTLTSVQNALKLANNSKFK